MCSADAVCRIRQVWSEMQDTASAFEQTLCDYIRCCSRSKACHLGMRSAFAKAAEQAQLWAHHELKGEDCRVVSVLDASVGVGTGEQHVDIILVGLLDSAVSVE